MSENKKSLNPWVPVVLMGVVTILFGAYAVQSQTDLLDMKKECEQLKAQVTECATTSQKQLKEANANLEHLLINVEIANQALQDCQKSKKRK
jgi:hypothetical protein